MVELEDLAGEGNVFTAGLVEILQVDIQVQVAVPVSLSPSDGSTSCGSDKTLRLVCIDVCAANVDECCGSGYQEGSPVREGGVGIGGRSSRIPFSRYQPGLG